MQKIKKVISTCISVAMLAAPLAFFSAPAAAKTAHAKHKAKSVLVKKTVKKGFGKKRKPASL